MTARICPQCRRHSDAVVCPADGYSTVDARRYGRQAAEALVGQVFDERYRIEECIGIGGMGTVFRAMQLSMQRPVALKILKREYAANLDQVQRFQTEARAASALDHPHTIRVYDFGQSPNGDLYLVTELLSGQPLSTPLREGPLRADRAIRITCQVLKSLSEAHARGIIHRDLKPENIFLKQVHGEADFAKVLDFGIAKVVRAGADSNRVTTTGTVVGTPLYMSPEQARGHSVDLTTDLYSLGAVLWEMLTGAPPFIGDTAMAVMMAHVQSPLPPLALGDGPQAMALERIVAWALAKDPRARPPSADVLRQRLEGWLDGGDAGVRVPTPALPRPTIAAPTSDEPEVITETPEVVSAPSAMTREAIAVAHRGRRIATALALVLAVAGGVGAWLMLAPRLRADVPLALTMPAPATEAPVEARPGAAPASPAAPVGVHEVFYLRRASEVATPAGRRPPLPALAAPARKTSPARVKRPPARKPVPSLRVEKK